MHTSTCYYPLIYSFIQLHFWLSARSDHCYSQFYVLWGTFLLISSSQLVLSPQWTCKLIRDRIHCITWEMLAEGTTMHGPDYPVCPSWSSKMGRNSCVVYGIQISHCYSLRGPWTWSSCHRHWSSLRSAVVFWTLNLPEQSSGLPQSPRCQQGQLFPFPPIRWWTVPGQCHPWHIGGTQ